MKRLERLLARALESLDDGRRVAAALPRTPAGSRARVGVVAVGKAAPAMAAGALDRWSERIERVVVVTNDGTAAAFDDRRVLVVRARHPVPDARSVRGGTQCLAVARWCAEAPKERELLVLVSGGASALVAAPTVSLREKQAVTQAMLRSGASIQELNVVRKHLSRIKGGGLARAAAPARVVTLSTSDVIGGTLGDIGSGPASADASTVADARRLLRKYAPELAHLALVRTGAAPNVGVAKIIASPEELAKVFARELRATGMTVRVLPPSQDTAEALAADYLRLARRAGPIAFVRAAEPSVTVRSRSPGRGGRSTHLAALVGRSLPCGATFMAAATDGVDGLSDTGGAIVDGAFAERAGEAAIARALERYDTGTLHRAAGTALPLRPSGKNLADLHVLLVSGR